jgi:hypothetical protein
VPANRDATEFEPRRPRRDVAQLLRQIRALTLELRTLRLRGTKAPDLRDKERALEQLRWRLAVVARRAAVDEGGSS